MPSSSPHIASASPASPAWFPSELSVSDKATLLHLSEWFSSHPRIAVAFSGGVDSALVAFLARRVLGRDAVEACIADTPSLPRRDLALAEAFCKTHDIRFRKLQTAELQDPAYNLNGFDRCYHCKTHLYRSLREIFSAVPSGLTVCSGANMDDLGDYRPGLGAAAEAGVLHPLVDCRVGKSQVRKLARLLALEVWDKPASPCLSSRLPYGEAVTLEKLHQIEAAEDWLHSRGFEVCRVRLRQGAAVLELPLDRLVHFRPLSSEFHTLCLSLGFASSLLDEEGFVSGKLNRALNTKPSPQGLFSLK